MPYLVAFGALKRDLFELGEEVVVVGRERKATFSLSDFQVSRRHAEITFKDGTYHVRDLNSRNGFFHNQKHVKSGEGIDLDHGDELVLGRTGLRYYRRDPGDIESLTAPIIPEPLKNLPNTRPEEGEAKPRKNSARAAKKSARNSNADQDVVKDDDFGVETDDAANVEPAPAKKKGAGLDSEVLKYAAGGARPKAPEEESKSKRNRFTELSEDVGETKASARSKKASARQKAANPSSKSARSEGASEKKGDSRRRKKSTGRVPVQKGSSGREKANSGREKASSGRSSAKQAVAAEVQSLRTLLDRTEKERKFYRHLTVAMVAFLMLLMSLLFVKLMSGDSDDEGEPKTEETKGNDTKRPGRRPTAMVLNVPKNGLENAKRLDKDTFVNAILPILKTKCAVCHGPSSSKSKFRFDPNNEKQSLAMAASYVLPGRPDRSFLLQKPLPKSEGGEIHKGGAVFKTDSEDFRAMHGWINDVRTPGENNDPETEMNNSELAPVAKISVAKKEVAVGERVVLDSGNSVSKTNNTLLVTWSIDRKPSASRSFIDDDSGTTTSFIPDAPGEYLIQLVVQDDSLTGSASVIITASGNGSGNMGGSNDPDPDPKPKPKPDPKDVGPAMAVVAPIYRKLTGKDLTDSVYKKVKEKSLRRTARSILKTTTAKVYLLQNELATFGLTGASKPQSYYLKILAKPLNKDEGKNIDFAFVEMVISPYFNSKHSDAKSWTNAIFESFLGRKPRGAERSAAMKMWSSKESKLFGQKGRGQADAAGILAKQPEFVKNFLKRTYKLYMGSDPEDAVVDKAYEKYQESPEDFWKIIERWVVPKKS